MNRDFWYNWWTAVDQIAIPPRICPPSPEGQAQTAPAVIASADWHQAFIVAAFITLGLALAAVLVTYETRSMGAQFRSRWFKGLALTMLLTGLVCLVWLAWGPKVNTGGCEFGNVATHLPFLSALNRALVAVVQSGILFFFLSWLLTRVARVSGRSVWVNNSHFPVA